MEVAVLFSHDIGVFADAVYRICNGYEHKHDDTMSPECSPVFWRVSGRDPVRQHETGGSETAAQTRRFHPEPAV